MVSLDINISSVNNPIAHRVREANERETDALPEEDQAELSENATFGHNFPIDLTFLGKKRRSTDILLTGSYGGFSIFCRFNQNHSTNQER